MTTPNADKDVEEQKFSCTACRNEKWHKCFGRQFGIFIKLNIILPYDPAIAHLGIYPKKSKTYVHTKNLHISIYNNLL